MAIPNSTPIGTKVVVCNTAARDYKVVGKTCKNPCLGRVVVEFPRRSGVSRTNYSLSSLKLYSEESHKKDTLREYFVKDEVTSLGSSLLSEQAAIELAEKQCKETGQAQKVYRIVVIGEVTVPELPKPVFTRIKV